MDLKAVRETAIEATARFFWERDGTLPDQESEEWEAEYRRQFDRVKAGQAQGVVPEPAADASSEPALPEATLAELTGAPTQLRWAAQIRADRLKEVRDRGIRDWLATTWTKAKSWLDTRDLPMEVFLQRIEPHYRDYRREADKRAAIERREREAKEEAAAALRQEIEKKGITVEGLVELVDASERRPAAPRRDKLAELSIDGRNLRIFETTDRDVLAVLEKNGDGRSEYAIERDLGLAEDLALYARALELF